MTTVLEVGATIYAPRDDVFDLLRDVEGYGAYTDHVREVVRRGDGAPGTRYEVLLSWWKLSYVLCVELTGLDPPRRIDWEVEKDFDAHGAWLLEPETVDDPTVDEASRVTLTVRYEPESVNVGAFSLPRFVPTSLVFDRLQPVAEAKAQRVLDLLVADLEGEPRRATLSVDVRSDVE